MVRNRGAKGGRSCRRGRLKARESEERSDPQKPKLSIYRTVLAAILRVGLHEKTLKNFRAACQRANFMKLVRTVASRCHGTTYHVGTSIIVNSATYLPTSVPTLVRKTWPTLHQRWYSREHHHAVGGAGIPPRRAHAARGAPCGTYTLSAVRCQARGSIIRIICFAIVFSRFGASASQQHSHHLPRPSEARARPPRPSPGHRVQRNSIAPMPPGRWCSPPLTLL